MTDTLDAYREVIADLKRRRDGIDQIIGILETLLGRQWVAQPDADMPFRGMKVLDAAKAVLHENGEPMSPATITKKIRAGGCNVSSARTVASTLHRYAKENDDVFSPERGLWGIRSDADQTEPIADISTPESTTVGDPSRYGLPSAALDITTILDNLPEVSPEPTVGALDLSVILPNIYGSTGENPDSEG